MVASRRFAILAAAASLAGLAGCARSVPVTTNRPREAAAEIARWTTDLRPPSMSSAAVIVTGTSAGGAQASSYGTASFTRIEGTGRVRYEVNVTSPPAAGRQLAWALHTGSCTTPTPPVIPINELPPLDINTGGGGAVRGEVAASLDAKTTYSLRVYTTSRATDVNGLLLCGRLSYSGRR